MSVIDSSLHIEEFKAKCQDAAAFIQRINAERDERRRRDQEKINLINEKTRKESEELARKLKEEEEEILRKRKERNMKAHNKLKKKRELDQQIMLGFKHKISITNEYLYKKLEDKYNKEVLMPILEEKKKELAKKRNQFKSVNRKEFKEHIKKYDLLIAQREESRKKEIRARKEKEIISQKILEKYKTAMYEKQNKENVKKKEEEDKKKHEVKELREKMLNYAELIKEAYDIRPSSAKAKELKHRIAELKHPVRRHRDTKKQYNLAVINKRNNYSTGESDRVHNDSLKGNNTYLINVSEEEMASTSKRAGQRRFINGISQELIREDKSGKINYLSEMRRQRELKYEEAKPFKYNWYKDLYNISLDTEQRYKKIINKVNSLEEKALTGEKILESKGGIDKNPGMNECVSDMFLDVIKAKLAVLEHL